MNLREKYFETFKQNCDEATKLTEIKNKGYTGGSNDPFSNFRFAAQLASLPGETPITVEQTILSRMADKISRLKSLLVRPDFATTDESILDTMRDLFVYSNILLIYLQLGKPGPDTEYNDVFIPEWMPTGTGTSGINEKDLLQPQSIKDAVKGIFGWGVPITK